MESNSTEAMGEGPGETAGRGRPAGTGARASDAVKRVRSALGLTQMDMAIRLGLAESTLQRLEKLGRLPQSRASQNLLEQMAKQAGEII